MMKDGVGCGQYGEDRLLAMFFRSQPVGMLVDVGAADGYMNSNSIGLLRRPGWRGVLIDPLPEHANALRARYARREGVSIYQTGVGVVTGTQSFHCGGQVSTFDDETKIAKEDAHHINYKTILAPIMRLTDVLDDAGLVGVAIDFLAIDAEGMDYDVWRSLDKSKYSPRLVCIEGHGHRMDGYRELCRCGGNTFYVREDQCPIL